MSYVDSYGRTYKTVNSKGVTTETTYDDYDRVTNKEITSSVGTMKTSKTYTEPENGTYRKFIRMNMAKCGRMFTTMLRVI